MMSGKQKRYLRSLAVSLKPLIHLGKEGITSSVIEAIDNALEHHELVKINLLKNCELERDEAINIIIKELKSELIQKIGRNFLIYRENPQDRKIKLPR